MSDLKNTAHSSIINPRFKVIWGKRVRNGQRSVRLNRAYRVIYVENRIEDIIIVDVVEVNKHEY